MAIARLIIVDTNDGAFIRAAVNSGLRQTVDTEVVVVDNASTDGSPSWLRAIPGVSVVARKENRGFGTAVNTGAAGTDAAFIALLNPDAEATPSWIETITRWMDESGIDVACSYVAAGNGYYFTGGRWWWWCGGSTDDRTPKPERRTDFINGCSLVIRTELFQALEGFDEGFFLYSEDVDLSLRAVAAGGRLGVLPQPLVRHDAHGSSTKALGSKKWTHAFASRGRMVAKHCPMLVRPFALVVQAFVVPVRFAGGVRAALPLIRSVFEGYHSFRREGAAR